MRGCAERSESNPFSRIDMNQTRIGLVDPHAPGRDQPDRLRQQRVLGGMNRLLRLVPVAARRHRDGPLQDDRPGVHPLVDEVNGHPRDLRTVVDRLLQRVDAGEGGQQRRVHVDQPGGGIAPRNPPRAAACSRQGRPDRPRVPRSSRPAPGRAPRGPRTQRSGKRPSRRRPSGPAPAPWHLACPTPPRRPRSPPRRHAAGRGSPGGSCRCPRRARRCGSHSRPHPFGSPGVPVIAKPERPRCPRARTCRSRSPDRRAGTRP